MRKQITDSDVTEFMSEFARYLLAAGLTSARFSLIARVAFFRAASASAKFANSRLNRSAVAAMTGLTRAQVREFARAEKLVPKSRPDHIEKIIRGWNSDASFTTADQLPRRLNTSGRGATFGQLIRKYGGDIPPRSILREMVRNELVVVKGQYVHLHQRVRQTKSQTQLHHLSQILAQLLRNPNSLTKGALSLRSIVREVSYPSPSPKGRALMNRKSAEGLRAFLTELQTAGMVAAVEAPPSNRRKSAVTRTRIMVITEELDYNENLPKAEK